MNALDRTLESLSRAEPAASDVQDAQRKLEAAIAKAPRRRAPRVAGWFATAASAQVDVAVAVLVQAGQRVVQHGECAMRARQPRDVRNVGNAVHRIGRAFEDHQARGPQINSSRSDWRAERALARCQKIDLCSWLGCR